MENRKVHSQGHIKRASSLFTKLKVNNLLDAQQNLSQMYDDKTEIYQEISESFEKFQQNSNKIYEEKIKQNQVKTLSLKAENKRLRQELMQCKQKISFQKITDNDKASQAKRIQYNRIIDEKKLDKKKLDETMPKQQIIEFYPNAFEQEENSSKSDCTFDSQKLIFNLDEKEHQFQNKKVQTLISQFNSNLYANIENRKNNKIAKWSFDCLKTPFTGFPNQKQVSCYFNACIQFQRYIFLMLGINSDPIQYFSKEEIQKIDSYESEVDFFVFIQKKIRNLGLISQYYASLKQKKVCAECHNFKKTSEQLHIIKALFKENGTNLDFKLIDNIKEFFESFKPQLQEPEQTYCYDCFKKTKTTVNFIEFSPFPNLLVLLKTSIKKTEDVYSLRTKQQKIQVPKTKVFQRELNYYDSFSFDGVFTYKLCAFVMNDVSRRHVTFAGNFYHENLISKNKTLDNKDPKNVSNRDNWKKYDDNEISPMNDKEVQKQVIANGSLLLYKLSFENNQIFSSKKYKNIVQSQTQYKNLEFVETNINSNQSQRKIVFTGVFKALKYQFSSFSFLKQQHKYFNDYGDNTLEFCITQIHEVALRQIDIQKKKVNTKLTQSVFENQTINLLAELNQGVISEPYQNIFKEQYKDSILQGSLKFENKQKSESESESFEIIDSISLKESLEFCLHKQQLFEIDLQKQQNQIIKQDEELQNNLQAISKKELDSETILFDNIPHQKQNNELSNILKFVNCNNKISNNILKLKPFQSQVLQVDQQIDQFSLIQNDQTIQAQIFCDGFEIQYNEDVFKNIVLTKQIELVLRTAKPILKVFQISCSKSINKNNKLKSTTFFTFNNTGPNQITQTFLYQLLQFSNKVSESFTQAMQFQQEIQIQKSDAFKNDTLEITKQQDKYSCFPLKLDLTLDLKGCFFIEENSINIFKDKIALILQKKFMQQQTLLPLGIKEFQIYKKTQNKSFQTCIYLDFKTFKNTFVVLQDKNDNITTQDKIQQVHFLTVKIYNKTWDLFTKSSTINFIGNNLSKIICFKTSADAFNKKIQLSSETCMTRIELSFFFLNQNGILSYPNSSETQTKFIETACDIMQQIMEILNQKELLQLSSKKQSLDGIFNYIQSNIKYNAVVITDKSIAILWGKSDKVYYFGHHQTKSMPAINFINEYALPGSKIDVFYVKNINRCINHFNFILARRNPKNEYLSSQIFSSIFDHVFNDKQLKTFHFKKIQNSQFIIPGISQTNTLQIQQVEQNMQSFLSNSTCNFLKFTPKKEIYLETINEYDLAVQFNGMEQFLDEKHQFSIQKFQNSVFRSLYYQSQDKMQKVQFNKTEIRLPNSFSQYNKESQDIICKIDKYLLGKLQTNGNAITMIMNNITNVVNQSKKRKYKLKNPSPMDKINTGIQNKRLQKQQQKTLNLNLKSINLKSIDSQSINLKNSKLFINSPELQNNSIKNKNENAYSNNDSCEFNASQNSSQENTNHKDLFQQQEQNQKEGTNNRDRDVFLKQQQNLDQIDAEQDLNQKLSANKNVFDNIVDIQIPDKQINIVDIQIPDKQIDGSEKEDDAVLQMFNCLATFLRQFQFTDQDKASYSIKGLKIFFRDINNNDEQKARQYFNQDIYYSSFYSLPNFDWFKNAENFKKLQLLGKSRKLTILVDTINRSVKQGRKPFILKKI